MLLRYDTQADAKYLTLQPEKANQRGVAARTEKLEDWLLVDYDRGGKIFGIEILFASRHPVSLSVIDGEKIHYSLKDEADFLEGEVVMVRGEAVVNSFI